MCTEIEAKLKVDSHRTIADKLAQVGAEFVAEQLQKDWYFDDSRQTLTKTDRCLRLRRQLVGEFEKVFLTYKGAREKGRFKKRQEVDIEVNDADLLGKLLSGLGYQKVLFFEKKRQVWRFGGCEVALDHLPVLGDFVEIEGPDEEKIADVQRRLGLVDLPHVRESYAALMTEELCRLGKEQKEAYL